MITNEKDIEKALAEYKSELEEKYGLEWAKEKYPKETSILELGTVNTGTPVTLSGFKLLVSMAESLGAEHIHFDMNSFMPELTISCSTGLVESSTKYLQGKCDFMVTVSLGSKEKELRKELAEYEQYKKLSEKFGKVK